MYKDRDINNIKKLALAYGIMDAYNGNKSQF